MCLTETTRAEEITGDRPEILALAHTLINDLRSPLAAVRVGAELLTRHDQSPAQSQRLARNVLVSAARLEEILLDFASQLDVAPPSELLRNAEKIPEIRKHARAGRCELTTDGIRT